MKGVALMRRTILLVTVALLMVAFTSVAQAQPAEQAPVGPTGHPHHVLTGNGGCVDIDSVAFEGGPGARGLHLASFASGGPAQGPWHGPCS